MSPGRGVGVGSPEERLRGRGRWLPGPIEAAGGTAPHHDPQQGADGSITESEGATPMTAAEQRGFVGLTVPEARLATAAEGSTPVVYNVSEASPSCSSGLYRRGRRRW